MEENDWTTVRKGDKKRVMRRRGTPRTPSVFQNRIGLDDCLVSSEELDGTELCLSMLHNCQRELEAIGVLQQVLDQAPKRGFTNLVCYGIGNFSNSSSLNFSAPLYQMALALLLRERWAIASCSYLDPCISEVERAVLRHHNVKILINQQGKQKFEDESTLIFMPHCPKQLYDNVVWAHFDQLDRIVLLGNSLLNYVNSLSATNDGNHLCPCLNVIQPFVKEALLRLVYDANAASGNLEGAMNDTYWTIFDVDGEGTCPLMPRPDLPAQLDHMSELL